MRLALLSDLHANLRAFEACLAHARAQGADRFALLGDLVGYGAEPAAVVDLVMQLHREGAVVLQGNHDFMAVHGLSADATGRGAARPPANDAEAGVAWTREQLTPDHRAFLQGLPLTQQVGECLLVHATADDPPAWRYATTPPLVARSLEAARERHGARCVFGGHVHEQRLWYAGRRGDLMPFEPSPGACVSLTRPRFWLATIGSVGQPRDGDPRAAYALYDDGPSARLSFFRVRYDHAAAAEAVRASGLPARLADRLLEGR